MQNLSIIDSKFSDSISTISIDSATGSNISVNNLSYLNVTISNKVSLLSLGATTQLAMNNLTFTQIYPLDSNEVSNMMINLEEISSNTDSNISLSNIKVSNSSVSFIKISNSLQSESINQHITIKQLEYSNCTFNSYDSLIETESVISSAIFLMTFLELNFKNINFKLGGDLFLLKHQSNEDLVIQNSVFNNISFGGFKISSFYNTNNSKKTLVNVSNSTFNNIDAYFKSLFELKVGGELKINNSSISKVSNLNSGSIISAENKATAIIINSAIFNNTSIDGIFYSGYEGSIKFYSCNIYNNFAIENTIIKANENGFFEIYQTIISNNYAFYAPICIIFSSQIDSVINNSTITGNIVMNKQAILNSILPQTFLSFQQYIQNNLGMFDQVSGLHAIQLIYGHLKLENNTLIDKQDYFLNTIGSQLNISSLIIQNNITESNLTGIDIAIRQISGNSFVLLFFNSHINLANFSYASSSVGMIMSSYSSLEFDRASARDITSEMDIISLRLDTVVSFINSEFISCSGSKNKIIEGISVEVSIVKNIQFINCNSNSLHLHTSIISNFDTILMKNCSSCIDIYNTQISLLTNSTFINCGSSKTLYGGAIYSSYSNSTIQNSTFDGNLATNGGAIYYECSILNQCTNILSNNTFINNKGYKGGSISYNANRPQMNGNIFINNSANYGPNIGSYPVSIVEKTSNNRIIKISNIGSGIPYQNELSLSLIDYDNQVCVLENNSIIKIVPSSSDLKIHGIDYAKLTNGTSVFQSIKFAGKPGLTNSNFKIQSATINNKIISSILQTNQSDYKNYDSYISVSFRYCMPGEIQDNGECTKCSYLTYSLDWNSTLCSNCIDNAACMGESNITVNEGYWRYKLNSTTIIKCPREQSCLGGYFPQNQYPISCAEGYGGYLCAECQILNGTKYQRESNYECLKCPDSTLNIIRLIGYVAIALIFISAILYVNIRKKNENQFSILMRIFTNYIQLISVSLTFNISLPTVFNDVFNQSNRVESPNESFFSFDCFIEDAEIKGFAPSASLFKLFLYCLLPLALFLFYFTIFLIIKLVLSILNKGHNFDIKRYMGVTIVCIIFIFHPSMILQSLNSFSCQQIDAGVYKMKEYMQYDCYSNDHILWASITGLPILIIWVIGMPLAALIILIYKRNALDDWTIKKYFLILYQGLRPKVFYWEFINTFRKVVILLINVALISYSLYFRVLVVTSFLFIIIKVQDCLKPYKCEENNKIEMTAIIAAFTTFYCAIIFISLSSSPVGFNEFAIFLMFSINAYFIIHWTFLMLCSIGWNNQKFQLFLSVYSLVICRKKAFFAENYENKKNNVLYEEKLKPKIKNLNKSKKHKKFKKISRKKLLKPQNMHRLKANNEGTIRVFELNDQSIRSIDSLDNLNSHYNQIVQTPKESDFTYRVDTLKVFKKGILSDFISQNKKLENRTDEILTNLRKIKYGNNKHDSIRSQSQNMVNSVMEYDEVLEQRNNISSN